MNKVLSLLIVAVMVAALGIPMAVNAEHAVHMYDADIDGNISNIRAFGNNIETPTRGKAELRFPPEAEAQVVQTEVTYGELSHNPFTTAFAPQIDRNPGPNDEGYEYEDVVFIYEDEYIEAADPAGTARHVKYALWSGAYGGFWTSAAVSTEGDVYSVRRKTVAYTSDGVAHILYGFSNSRFNPADRRSLQMRYATLTNGFLEDHGTINPGSERGLSYPVVKVNAIRQGDEIIREDLYVVTMDYDRDGWYLMGHTDEEGEWIWDGEIIEDPDGIYGWGVVNSAVDPVTNDFYVFWPTDFNGDQCADLAVKKLPYGSETWEPAPTDSGYVMAYGNHDVTPTLVAPQGTDQQQYDFLCWPNVVIDNDGYIHVVFSGNMVDWPATGEDGPGVLSFWNIMGLAGALYYTRSENPRDPSSWLDPQPLLDRDPDHWYENLASVGGISIDPEDGTLYFVYHKADSVWADPAAASGWGWELPVNIEMIHWNRDFDWWDTANPDLLYRQEYDEDEGDELYSYHNTTVAPYVVGPSHTDDETAWGLDVAFGQAHSQDGSPPYSLFYVRGPYHAGGSGLFVGTVTDEGGNPIGDVEVIAQSGNLAYTAYTDENGQYELRVPPGTFTLTAYNFYYEEEMSEEMTIGNGEEVTVDFTLTVLPAGTLYGRVASIYDEGAPFIEEATVTIMGTPLETMSDMDGWYRFDDMPIGEYTVHAYKPGYGTEEFMVTITEGQSVRHDIGLLVAESFEENDGGWVASGDENWEWGIPNYNESDIYDYRSGTTIIPYHGEKTWGTRMDSHYYAPCNSYLESPLYTLAEGQEEYLFEFQILVRTVHLGSDDNGNPIPEDGVNVQMAVDGGEWTLVEPIETPVTPPVPGYDEHNIPGLGGENGWSGSYGGWMHAQYDLSDYVGQDVQFRLRLGARELNGGAEPEVGVDSLFAGVYIDNVVVRGQETFTSVDDDNTISKVATPQYYAVSQNYPNPFNPRTAINYQLPVQSDVTINVYDIQGRLVKTLVNETKEAGGYTAVWTGIDNNGRSVSSGVYFYRIKAGDFERTKQMVLLR